MRSRPIVIFGILLSAFGTATVAQVAPRKPTPAAIQQPPPSSYMPVVPKEDFSTVMSRMKSEKAGIVARQNALLAERYDLGNRPAKGVTMTRGKAVQEGVRIKLSDGSPGKRSPT
jgi:hypothetical protein